MPEPPPASRRSTPGPPAPARGEIVRPRLLDELGRRFVVPVTVVSSGAGFGKSTLLAQAIRANLAAPCGLDAWVSCEDGDGDAGRLATAIVEALGGSSEREEALERIRDVVDRLAPNDVCIVLDDVHMVPDGSSGADLLVRLVADLPPHLHLLVAGRRPPGIQIARWRANDLVVDLGDDELAFTTAEVATFARALDHDVERLMDMGGWPSLLRLAASAPPGSGRQFLWEEIVATLDDQERRVLLALAMLGGGTVDDVVSVLDTNGRPDLEELTSRVPLMHGDGTGRFGLHQLWDDVVVRMSDPDELHLVRQRVLALRRQRSETVRGGWLAVRWGDGPALAGFAVDLVRDSYGALPIDTAARWLAAAPGDARRSPEMELLSMALLHARRFDDLRLDDGISRVVERFRAAGDDRGEAVTVALAAVVAQCKGDLGALVSLTDRAERLGDVSEVPWLGILGNAMAGAVASLTGDAAAGVTALEQIDQTCLPSGFSELVVRLHANLLAFDGRASEAVTVARPLERAPTHYVRSIPAHLRWLSGDPNGFAAGWPGVDPGPDTNERYFLYHAAYGTTVAASFGDRAALDDLRPVVEKFAAAVVGGRERAMTTVAIATRLVAEGDESGAAGVVADHADQFGDDPLADMHLRRTLAVPYVLHASVRERWRTADLGPSHRRQRTVAETLLAARDGRPSTWPAVDDVFTALPLVWAAELAARVAAQGDRFGTDLARSLLGRTPTATHAALRVLAGGDDLAAASGAVTLLALLPDPDRPTVVIDVLGPLRVHFRPDASASPELRRGPVRALLVLLVLTGPLSRDQAAQLLWPDADQSAAARNLRVTLSRLRRALSPQLGGTPLGSVVETSGDQLAIAGPPLVEIDQRAFVDDVGDATTALGRGDTGGAIDALTRACARWRGEPCAELTDMDGVRAVRERLVRDVHEATLRLGELLLVAGRFDDAAGRAEQVIVAAPYSERAHRLAVAAHVQRRDRVAVTSAVDLARAMLDELDVDPEPATAMVFRQAARLGRPAAPSEPGWVRR